MFANTDLGDFIEYMDKISQIELGKLGFAQIENAIVRASDSSQEKINEIKPHSGGCENEKRS